jgi:hypothetical protein
MVAAFLPGLIERAVVYGAGPYLHQIALYVVAAVHGVGVVGLSPLEPETIQHVAVQSAVEHLHELWVLSQLLYFRGLLQEVLVANVVDQLGFDQSAETLTVEETGLCFEVFMDAVEFKRELS